MSKDPVMVHLVKSGLIPIDTVRHLIRQGQLPSDIEKLHGTEKLPADMDGRLEWVNALADLIGDREIELVDETNLDD